MKRVKLPPGVCAHEDPVASLRRFDRQNERLKTHCGYCDAELVEGDDVANSTCAACDSFDGIRALLLGAVNVVGNLKGPLTDDQRRRFAGLLFAGYNNVRMSHDDAVTWLAWVEEIGLEPDPEWMGDLLDAVGVE